MTSTDAADDRENTMKTRSLSLIHLQRHQSSKLSKRSLRHQTFQFRTVKIYCEESSKLTYNTPALAKALTCEMRNYLYYESVIREAFLFFTIVSCWKETKLFCVFFPLISMLHDVEGRTTFVKTLSALRAHSKGKKSPKLVHNSFASLVMYSRFP